MQLSGLLNANARNAELHLKHTHGLGLAVLNVARQLKEFDTKLALPTITQLTCNRHGRIGLENRANFI